MTVQSATKKNIFWEFLGDRNVGAISASSPFLMRRVVHMLKPEDISLLIELGPGDGVAGRAILPHLPSDATYVAIETNPHFTGALKLHPDPRMTVIDGKAQDMERLVPAAVGHADAVIASIPFSFISEDERRSITASVKKMLRPGGTFIVFHQYSTLMAPYLRAEFGNETTEFELVNIFPCFTMKATR